MTRSNEEQPLIGGEPMLVEIETLRRLAALEIAPQGDRERVLAGVRRELSAQRATSGRISRPWGIALLALGTSTALAATPPGRKVVREVQRALTGAPSVETKGEPVRGSRPPIATRRELVHNERRREELPSLAQVPDLPVAPATETRPPATEKIRATSKVEPAARRETTPSAETQRLEAEERELVEQARFALGQGRYADARRLSEEHRRRFPNGKLGPERDAIERQVQE